MRDKPQSDILCEWCGASVGCADSNTFFTEKGRVLCAGCFLTVFDEHFDERAPKESA